MHGQPGAQQLEKWGVWSGWSWYWFKIENNRILETGCCRFHSTCICLREPVSLLSKLAEPHGLLASSPLWCDRGMIHCPLTCSSTTGGCELYATRESLIHQARQMSIASDLCSRRHFLTITLRWKHAVASARKEKFTLFTLLHIWCICKRLSEAESCLKSLQA